MIASAKGKGLGSGVSMRSFLRVGSSISVYSTYAYPIIIDAPLQVNGYVQTSSSFSVRSFTRLGSSVSAYGVGRLGSCFSVLDFVTFGSSMSLRSFCRHGSSVSLYDSCRKARVRLVVGEMQDRVSRVIKVMRAIYEIGYAPGRMRPFQNNFNIP